MAGTKGIRAGRAYVEVFADNSMLIKGLRQAENKIRAFGQSLRKMGLYMTTVGAAITALLFKASKIFGDMGDNLAKMSKRTGLSVQFLSQLEFVTSQTGSSMEGLEKAVRRMQGSIYDLSLGLSTSVDAFNALGLSIGDLAGLSPEQQFDLITTKIAGMTDVTIQAAIAQRMFGRSGTALLPMIKSGTANIAKLKAEARKLGLIMSDEDAAAAEEWKDTLDKLTRTIKMAFARIGQSVIPLLEKMANKIIEVSVAVQKFVKVNRGIIESALKIGIAILGAGATFLVFSAAISGVASIIAGLRITLSAIGTLIGLLLSPLGLIAIAAVGITAAFGKLGSVTDWLKDKFFGLKSDAIAAFGGIQKALALGDIGLAAKILWLTLKMEWQKGILAINKVWQPFYYSLIEIWTSGAFGDAVKYATNIAWEHIKTWAAKVFELIKGIATLGIQPLIKKLATNLAISKKADQILVGQTGKTALDLSMGAKGGEETRQVAETIRKAKEQAKKEIMEVATKENLEQMFPGGNKMFDDILNNAESIKTNDVKMPQSLQDALSKGLENAAEKLKNGETDLGKTAYELAGILKELRTAVRYTVDDFNNPEGSTAPQPPEIPSISELMKKVSTFGTFSAFGLSQLGVSTIDQQQLVEMQKISKATKKIADNTDDGDTFD